MDKLKIGAIVLLVFLVLTFIGIIVTLILPNYSLFYVFGAALVFELAMGFVIKGIHKKRMNQETENE